MSVFESNLSLIREAILRSPYFKAGMIVAVDGRCASGKSTMAAALADVFRAEGYSCNLVHMDDFFLRPEQRTSERLATPGENVDHERFLEEVLPPLSKGASCTYRPYNCQMQALDAPIALEAAQITIVEGSYACHPALWDYYAMRIFLWVGEDTQLKRIAARSGEAAVEAFRQKWIPLEEAYFKHYALSERCDLVLRNE